MNWWELQPKKDENGKYIYQNATVKFTYLDEKGRPSKYGVYHDATIQTEDGTRNVPCSVYYQEKSNEPKFTQTNVNIPTDCKIKIEPNNTEHAFEGKKFTIMPGQVKEGGGSYGGGGGGGGGRGGWKPNPKGDYEKRLCMLLSYAKDLGTRDCSITDYSDTEIAKIFDTALGWSQLMDIALVAKFPDDVPI